jgi:Cu+-exporting ATPase
MAEHDHAGNAARENPPSGTIYTCPMHPEIRLPAPGNCPICGMTLEPVMPSLEEEENPELVDFRRRFWWTLPLTVIVTVLAMAGHKIIEGGLPHQSWIELALSTPVVLWAGWPFCVRWAQSIAHRSPNMWTLIGTGTGAAYGYSLVATIAPGLFPETFVMHGRIGVYFEAAAVIMSLTLLGQILELKARSQTSAAIKSLLGLAPNRPPHQARRHRGRYPTDACAHWRHAARPARRKGARGRCRAGRRERGRRIHAHRRAASGHEAAW